MTMTPGRWVALFTAIGAAIRFTGLNSDLWVDEIATLVMYLRLPPWEAVSRFESPNQHLLYSFLGSISLRMFGESAWSARLPAAVLGTATIPLFYPVARRWLDETPALWATLLLALNYHHVWFSQSARGYVPMIFFVVAAAWCLQRDRSGASLWNCAGYALSAGAAVLSVQTSAFLITGQMLTGGRRIFLSGLAGGVVALAGSIPILPALVHYYRTEDRGEFGADLSALFAMLLRFLWSGLAQGFLGAGALAVLAAIAFGAWRVTRAHPDYGRPLAIAMAIHATAMLAAHYGGYPRYALYLLPFAMVAAAAGIAAIARPAWRRATLALLILLSAAALWVNWRYPKQDYSGALAWVKSQAAPGDAIAAAGIAGKFYRLYHAPELTDLDTVDKLRALPADRRRWIIYTFPGDMRRRFGPLYDAIQDEAGWELVRQFRGTLDGGTMYVVRSRR